MWSLHKVQVGRRQGPCAGLLSAAKTLLGSRWESESTLETTGKYAEIFTHPLPFRTALWDITAILCRTHGTHGGGETSYTKFVQRAQEDPRFLACPQLSTSKSVSYSVVDGRRQTSVCEK